MEVPHDDAEKLPLRQVSQRCGSSGSQRTDVEEPSAQEWVKRLDKAKKEGNVIQTDPQDAETRYSIGRKLADGAFGVVYTAIRSFDGRQVAIKFEPKRCACPQLRDEFRTYKVMAGCYGIPKVYYFGSVDLHNVLILDLLGPSLEDLFQACGRRFTVKTVMMIAKQSLQMIQELHEHSLIYRDIKPDNFLIGRPETETANVVHFVDFGMAKRYRDPKTLQHIPYQDGKSVCGTLRYMSINAHLGQEQSRRDDLEALGNVFIYFLRGHLPWQGIEAATKHQRREEISNKKRSIAIEELCKGFDMICNYFQYVRTLDFEATPDYDYLRGLFSDTLRDNGEVDDGIYDWNELKQRHWCPKADRLDTAETLQEVKISEMEMTQTKRLQTPLEMSHIPKRSLVLSPGQEPRLSKRTSHTRLDERNKLQDSG